MGSKSSRVGYIAALAIALGLGATQLNAAQGTFNLPFEAHWGKIVLAPGEHKIQLPYTAAQQLIYLYTEKTTQMAVPITTGITTSDRSYIRLVNVDGTYYVDQFTSAANGRTFFFHVPKASTRTVKQEAKAVNIGVQSE